MNPQPRTLGPVSRRSFLSMAGLGIAGTAFLSACGGSSAGGSPSPTGSAGATGPLGQLDMYTWEGYDLPDVTADWRTKNGVEVKATYVGVQDDVATKLTSPAAKGIDSSTANQSFITYFNSLGIMSPITTEELPELEQMFPVFQGKPWRNDDGTYNSVPWTWGPLGLSYVPERLDAPTTWDILFDPAMKGRITLLDDPQQHTQLASAILGYNPDQLTQAQLADVKDFMIRVIKQAKTLTATTGDQVALMESGEVDLVFLGWTGIDAAAKDKGFEAITMIPPNQHSIGFSDATFIPPDADNRAAALAWSKAMITGDVAAKAAEKFFAATTNPEVVPLINEETRKPYPYDDLDSYFKYLTFPQGFPHESDQYVTLDQAVQAWEEIKGAAL